jgi:uncharacterized protein
LEQEKIKYYPTFLQAVHLVVLYIFIQTIVDFPLALYDYYNGTDLLYLPVKKVILGVGSILFILYYGYRKSKNKFREVFPAKSFNLLIILLIFPFLAGAQIIISEVNAGVEKLLPPPPWFFELFNNIFDSDYGWFGAFMKVVLIAPIVEESIFRGVIMNGFMRNYPKFLAIFFSALLFALFHLNPWQFPATFVLGLLLGWLMVRTRNIFACIAGHAVNNFLVLLSVTYWQEIDQSSGMAMEKWKLMALSGFVIFLSTLFIYLLSKKRDLKARQN